ncbi:21187_t:CDS:2 [Entrophospora sp. SA101]|nr:21187_t:CDS:2 [Entrophospora sp. SA101]
MSFNYILNLHDIEYDEFIDDSDDEIDSVNDNNGGDGDNNNKLIVDKKSFMDGEINVANNIEKGLKELIKLMKSKQT